MSVNMYVKISLPFAVVRGIKGLKLIVAPYRFGDTVAYIYRGSDMYSEELFNSFRDAAKCSALSSWMLCKLDL